MRKSTFASALLVAACSGGGGPAGPDPDGVSARAAGGSVRITNARADHVYWFLVEREDEPLIDWTPCTTGVESCPHVHAGETLAVPYVQIAGYDPGDDEATVYWWHLRSSASGLAPDSVRAIRVNL